MKKNKRNIRVLGLLNALELLVRSFSQNPITVVVAHRHRSLSGKLMSIECARRDARRPPKNSQASFPRSVAGITVTALAESAFCFFVVLHQSVDGGTMPRKPSGAFQFTNDGRQVFIPTILLLAVYTKAERPVASPERTRSDPTRQRLRLRRYRPIPLPRNCTPPYSSNATKNNVQKPAYHTENNRSAHKKDTYFSTSSIELKGPPTSYPPPPLHAPSHFRPTTQKNKTRLSGSGTKT